MWVQRRFAQHQDLLSFLNGDLFGSTDITDGVAVDGLTFIIDVGAGNVTTTFAPALGRPWTPEEVLTAINAAMGDTVATLWVGKPDPVARTTPRRLRVSYSPSAIVRLAGTANALLGFSAAADTVQTPVDPATVLSVDFEIETPGHTWVVTYNDQGVGAGGDVNLVEIAGAPVATTVLPGVLPVVGTVAHDSPDDGSEPLKVGGTVRAVLPTLANGDRAGFSTDTETRLHVRNPSYDSFVQADAGVNLNNDSLADKGEVLAALTNQADGTYDYYFNPRGYGKFALQYLLNGGTAPGTGVTMTIAGTWQDDGTADSACVYQDVTSTLTGLASIVAATGATNNGVILDTWGVLREAKYIRVKIVAQSTGASADWTLWARSKF
jgi:hypothetical protein